VHHTSPGSAVVVPCARAIEDLIVERGVREYVILGAGLDTARFTPPRINAAGAWSTIRSGFTR